jgi:hypothetical protein
MSRLLSRLRLPAGIPADSSAWALLVFVVPAAATGLLMPAFLRRLERNARAGTAAFYGRSALLGIVFGLVVTALLTWALMTAALWIGTFSSTPTESAGTIVGALALGTFLYAPLFAVSIALFFLPFILAAGIPFGLVFGYVVRRSTERARTAPTS